jgi:hypothetical protein
MRHFFRRIWYTWREDDRRATRSLFAGKTAGDRLDGFVRSERMDAKFLILGMAGVIPAFGVRELVGAHTTASDIAFWLGIVWLVLVSIARIAILITDYRNRNR